MTAECTGCGAATALQVLTYIRTVRREDGRGRHPPALCPACYAQWLEQETCAAVSLEQHSGRPGPKREGE